MYIVANPPVPPLNTYLCAIMTYKVLGSSGCLVFSESQRRVRFYYRRVENSNALSGPVYSPGSWLIS